MWVRQGAPGVVLVCCERVSGGEEVKASGLGLSNFAFKCASVFLSVCMCVYVCVCIYVYVCTGVCLCIFVGILVFSLFFGGVHAACFR